MSKQISPRVSFAGLKNDKNKARPIEQLFQNFKLYPLHSHNHSHSNLQNQQQYYAETEQKVNKNKQIHASSNMTTKFADIIRQRTKNNKNQNTYHQSQMQKMYYSVQESIKVQIQQYDAKYTEVTQILADLHIKDLMRLNQMIHKNQQIYQNYLKEQKQNKNKAYVAPVPMFNESDFQDSQKIYEVQRAINKIISQPLKSFDFRSTYQSKNKKTVSSGSSRVSQQISKTDTYKILQKNSQKLQKMVDSQKQNNQNSRFQNSKSGVFLHKNDSIQDTPQSVKSKISCTGKMKTEKDVNIGMFDRINVCESVEQIIVSGSSPFKSERPKQKNHRYAKNSPEYQQF